MKYFPEVLQVIPTEEYKVYIYFDDGHIKLFDAKELIKEGVFTQLQDIKLFMNTCTVLNDTLAWDINGTYDEEKCFDLDQIELYETCPTVEELDSLFISKSSSTNSELLQCVMDEMSDYTNDKKN